MKRYILRALMIILSLLLMIQALTISTLAATDDTSVAFGVYKGAATSATGVNDKGTISVTAASASDATDYAAKYTDVYDYNWFREAVSYVTEHSLMTGVTESEFAPRTAMSRAMLVTILGRAYGVTDKYPTDAAITFTDVSLDKWYSPYVAWAKANGIVSGKTDTTFCPTADVTRQEVAVIISRYLDFANIEKNSSGAENSSTTSGASVTSAASSDSASGANDTDASMSGDDTDADADASEKSGGLRDIADISTYAVPSVMCVSEAGIMTGDIDGYFHPRASITRAEAAKVIMTLMGLQGDDTIVKSLLYGIYTDHKEAEWIRQCSRHIIHAGGSIGGYVNTNCLEAIDNSYACGDRVIELDLRMSVDGFLVCTHDWPYTYSTRLVSFLAYRPHGLYTSMWLGTLAEWLKEHEGSYIITDIKEEDFLAAVRSIAESYPELKNRFIVQIYNESEYDIVSELGFEYIIYTLYEVSWEDKMDTDEIVRFAQTHKLMGITYPVELCDIPGYTDALLAAGVPLYVHTVNDPTEEQKYLDMGISGVYTDNP